MKDYQDKRKKKITEIITITKLLSLLFCGIIFLSIYVEKYGSYFITSEVIHPILTGVLSIAILALVYRAWMVSDGNIKRLNIKAIIECTLSILIFFILILISGAYESSYKIIFLFIIITSTIQLGKRYGIFIATICGALIIIMDLVLVPGDSINTYFEEDLILTGAFLLTAWLLGDYVEIEQKHIAQLTEMANKDGLTDVANHRYFQQVLYNEIEKAGKLKKFISLLFIDIDHFKEYNDLYGHMQGDKLLVKIAEIIKENIRSGDFVARYGGDEFAVILPNTVETEAVSIGERFRTAINEMYFMGQENLPKGKVSLSIGISSFPEKAKTVNDLIKSADQALYQAKNYNRDRIEVYSSVLEELQEDLVEEDIDSNSSIKIKK